MYILPRAFHTLVHCSDDKFSVVTRIQKHLSWDDLHIWTVKLRGRGKVHERKGEKWRIVIIAIISRLSTEWWSAMKVQRRPKYGNAVQKTQRDDAVNWKWLQMRDRFESTFRWQYSTKEPNDDLLPWAAKQVNVRKPRYQKPRMWRKLHENRKHLFIT